jgi:alpha-beta hydrolase superfamily lysophospholipase
VSETPSVQRHALYIGQGDDALFACYHHTGEASPARDCVAVICNPLGHEYVHSHRTLRHLADALARAGVPTLRFDYQGTGDSPGGVLDPDRLARWQADIRRAIHQAKALSGRTQVCLLGLRLGATLAALVAEQARAGAEPAGMAGDAVDHLVLWAPVVSGRRCVRELQVIAQAAEFPPEPGAQLEPAGFQISEQMQAQLKALALLNHAPRVRHALWVQRDDGADEPGLPAHFQSLGVPLDVVAGSGYAAMMAEPHRTTVPHATIAQVANWLLAQCPPGPPLPALPTLSHSTTFAFLAQDGTPVMLRESHARFGEQGALFGIYTSPAQPVAGRPTVVLFSSGSTHRMGPNRVYTQLARHLSAQGYPTFRADLGGIGDSVLPVGELEAHPYPPTAVRDARATVEFVRAHHGATALMVAGLCSGAYTAFRVALDQPEQPIPELLLINPLLFEHDGGPFPDVQSFRIAESTKGALRRRESWKKLLRGQIRVRYLLGMVLRHLGKAALSHVHTLAERLHLRAPPLLASHLRQLAQQGRRITVLLATGEAGWSILHSGARRTAALAERSGHLSLLRVAESDHTFSSAAARRRLVAMVLQHLRERFPPTAP